jgi:hypothetical protein
MTRFNRLALVAGVFCVVAALPALAADPTVSKSVFATEEGGSSVILLTVSGADHAVYGVTVSDASASLEDIIVPEGWVGIATDDLILFRTLEEPITSGKQVVFRIVTKNAGSTLGVTFRDLQTAVGSKKEV